jgi:transposase-like protein
VNINQKQKGTAAMSKKYKKKTTRSRRKNAKSLRGEVLSKNEATVQLSLPIAEVIAGVSDAVESLAAEAGLLVMKTLIEEEVRFIAGERYCHDQERGAVRWGQEEGYVVFAGRKVPITRPRVRDGHGEIPLKRYALFQSDRRLQDSMTRRILRGVSTRDYEGVLDEVCDGYGIQKSSVSRHWKAATAKELDKLMGRSLKDLDILVLMIDGIEFQGHLFVVSIGISADGKKHILGFMQGATENTEVCKSLLGDLVERGLNADRKYLFVLDGAKALRKAVRSFFGEKGIVQRCRIHKERNILSHLPDSYHPMVRQRLRAAWNMKSYKKAKAALQKLVNYLEGLNPSAAASLKEGMEETLTLHRLELPEALRKRFYSTNAIESCFSRMRDLCKNVKNWKNADMARRWAGTMLIEAQKSFRRIQGYRELPFLEAVLKDGVDSKRKAA